jgi:TRAP-type C4-dicarboxylate transport system substrate-binding protein
VNLDFAVYLPEADQTTAYMIRFLDLVKEYTNGTVDYTLYAGATLCAADEQLDAIRNGLADISFCASAYFAGLLPLTYMLEYPGVFYENDMAASNTIMEWHNTLAAKEMEPYQFLFGYGQGNGCFITNTPLRTVDDFKGVQMRTSAALVPVVQAYGFVPTAMTMGDVYDALRTGVIQGATGMVAAAYSFKLYEVSKYVTLDPYYISSYIMVMNKDVWASLSDVQREAITKATEDAFPEFIAPGRQNEVEGCLEFYEKLGLEIIRLPENEIAKMGQINSPLQEAYAASVEGGPEALALLKQLAEKYNAMYKDWVPPPYEGTHG